ncbi:MAG: hypothetical protein NZ551_06645 [Microscillaceae bacterium]|nr:hypothetical protein [Microscillaceae bacterium]MDW8460872.1 hypothetical protein [Cytophagales bacterium]
MKASQIYFNVMLTIIALCLIGILVQNQVMMERQAGILQSVQKQTTQATQFQQVKYPENSKFIVLPLNKDGGLDLNIKGLQEMDVNIRSIPTNDVLNVNLERIYGYYGGKLQVEQK